MKNVLRGVALDDIKCPPLSSSDTHSDASTAYPIGGIRRPTPSVTVTPFPPPCMTPTSEIPHSPSPMADSALAWGREVRGLNKGGAGVVERAGESISHLGKTGSAFLDSFKERAAGFSAGISESLASRFSGGSGRQGNAGVVKVGSTFAACQHTPLPPPENPATKDRIRKHNTFKIKGLKSVDHVISNQSVDVGQEALGGRAAGEGELGRFSESKGSHGKPETGLAWSCPGNSVGDAGQESVGRREEGAGGDFEGGGHGMEESDKLVRKMVGQIPNFEMPTMPLMPSMPTLPKTLK